jgi:putative transcriptional regulator
MKTMVKHHPASDFLTDFVAGTLPVPQAACISAHLNYCNGCRKSAEQLQTIGGVLMEQLSPVAVSESVLDTVLARLDDPAPLAFASQQVHEQEESLPRLLNRIINGDFTQLIWRRVTRSLSVSYLKTGDSDYEFALYRIAAGGQIPDHDHGGSEMTLVLEGGFSDERGTYHPGDFIFRTASETHAPVAIDGEECICLAVLDAPLKFTRWQYRWMNPFIQLQAG